MNAAHRPTLNRLTAALADLCRREPLTEKWLLAPSMRVGHQWLETVARSGQPVVNARVKTLKSMVLDLAAPEMARRGVTLLSARRGMVLADGVFRRLTASGPAYLGNLTPTARLAQTIYRSLDAIRLAGLGPADLDQDRFEVRAKGAEIVRLVDTYLDELKSRELIDYADTLRLALTRLQNDPHALPPGAVITWPEDLRLAALEQRLLEALPRQHGLPFPVDQSAREAEDRPPPQSDLEALSWLLRPTDAPPPVGDGSVSIFRAVGEVNEVRGVLRRCLTGGVPLDEVELLYTDTANYVPLIYETLAAAMPEPAEMDPAIGLPPMTFAEGIPCSYSRPGRALRSWVVWIADDFPQDRLVAMIREGLLAIPDGDNDETGFGRLASVLRSVGIGFGRDRYLSKLDAQIAAYERRQETQSENEVEDEDDGHAPIRRDSPRRLRDLQALRRVVEGLLALTPKSADQDAVLAEASVFLEASARCVDQVDTYARRRLLEDVADMRHCLGGGEASLDVWEWLAALPDEARILGSGPRPGHLHAAYALRGGHSGRPVTLLLGMDDGRVPGAGLQDPLLLDAERRALSPDLPTAAGELEEKVEALVRLFARLRGRLTLTYPSHDLADDREKFPSPLLLSAFRILSGDRDATQKELIESLPPPESFAPGEAEASLTSTEWWLWRLCNRERVADAGGLVRHRFPHLGRGDEALRRRLASELTRFDGNVPEAGRALDFTRPDGPIVSASRLETLGRCPLAFFFQYGLQVEPPEEIAIDPTRWLDPLAFGKLLHEVFEQFVRERIEAHELPIRTGQWPAMERILERQIERYRDRQPPASENVYRVQRRQLTDAARIFLTEEEQYCERTGSVPVYLESSLGMQSEGNGTPFDTEDPVPVRLPDGRTLRARGRIDRIDRIGEGATATYAVWDYKSGSSRRYTPGDPLRQGRVLQPALYVAMVEHRLHKAVSPEARLACFGFFFPNPRERGERIQWSPEQLTSGLNIAGRLASLVRSGTFVATTDANDCTYCDYLPICRDVEAVAAASRSKLDNQQNKALKPFAELRPDAGS